jgi:hypothetical protein
MGIVYRLERKVLQLQLFIVIVVVGCVVVYENAFGFKALERGVVGNFFTVSKKCNQPIFTDLECHVVCVNVVGDVEVKNGG